MDVLELAVLDAEEVRIGRPAAAIGVARAKRAEGHYGSDSLVNHEVPVRDVDAARYANVAGIIRSSLARMHPALGAVAGVTPRHQVFFPFQKSIQVSVRGRYQ